MSKAVGIDLGTTNSVVAVLEAGEPAVIPNAEGSRTTPSVVAFSKTGEVLVGEVAKRQAITNPDRTIRSVKRHMGTNWSIDIDGKAYTAQEISRPHAPEAEARRGAVPRRDGEPGRHHRPRLLRRRPAPGHQGGRRDRGPRGAAHHQRAHRGRARVRARQGRQRTRRSSSSTSAAARSTCRCSRSATACSRSSRPPGNTHLGGDDWDQRVMDWMVTEFKNAHGVDLANDKMALQRLKEAAEKAKIELSNLQETSINLPFITATSDGPLHLELSLTRARFQEMTADLLAGVQGPVRAGDPRRRPRQGSRSSTSSSSVAPRACPR